MQQDTLDRLSRNVQDLKTNGPTQQSDFSPQNPDQRAVHEICKDAGTLAGSSRIPERAAFDAFNRGYQTGVNSPPSSTSGRGREWSTPA